MSFQQSHRNQTDQELIRRLVAIDAGRLVVLGGDEVVTALSTRLNTRQQQVAGQQVAWNGVPSPQLWSTEEYRDQIIAELCDRLLRGFRFGHDDERTNWLFDRLVYYL